MHLRLHKNISLHPNSYKNQHSPPRASPEKYGSVWISMISIAARTSEPPPDFWYAHAMSLTVTGMPRLLRVFFALVTCSARSAHDRTLSNRGSLPNYKNRLKYIECGETKK